MIEQRDSSPILLISTKSAVKFGFPLSETSPTSRRLESNGKKRLPMQQLVFWPKLSRSGVPLEIKEPVTMLEKYRSLLYNHSMGESGEGGPQPVSADRLVQANPPSVEGTPPLVEGSFPVATEVPQATADASLGVDPIDARNKNLIGQRRIHRVNGMTLRNTLRRAFRGRR